MAETSAKRSGGENYDWLAVTAHSKFPERKVGGKGNPLAADAPISDTADLVLQTYLEVMAEGLDVPLKFKEASSVMNTFRPVIDYLAKIGNLSLATGTSALVRQLARTFKAVQDLPRKTGFQDALEVMGYRNTDLDEGVHADDIRAATDADNDMSTHFSIFGDGPKVRTEVELFAAGKGADGKFKTRDISVIKVKGLIIKPRNRTEYILLVLAHMPSVKDLVDEMDVGVDKFGETKFRISRTFAPGFRPNFLCALYVAQVEVSEVTLASAAKGTGFNVPKSWKGAFVPARMVPTFNTFDYNEHLGCKAAGKAALNIRRSARIVTTARAMHRQGIPVNKLKIPSEAILQMLSITLSSPKRAVRSAAAALLKAHEGDFDAELAGQIGLLTTKGPKATMAVRSGAEPTAPGAEPAEAAAEAKADVSVLLKHATESAAAEALKAKIAEAKRIAASDKEKHDGEVEAERVDREADPKWESAKAAKAARKAAKAAGGEGDKAKTSRVTKKSRK